MNSDKSLKLENVARQVKICQKCPLYKNTNKSVPGEGNPDSQIMFIGEGPGYHEDQQGRPFVGRAGKLLEELLQLIKLERKDVWIGNVVKHRPPENRDPQPEEIEACQPFLDEQIKIIDPKIIVTLGRFSMAKFFPEEKISRIHGQARFVDFAGKRYIIIPMYHPAAALRSGDVMRELKANFLNIVRFLSEDESKDDDEGKTNDEKKEEQLTLIN